MFQPMMGNTVISGSECSFCYEPETEKITIYMGQRNITVPDETDIIIGQKFGMMAGGNTLYKLSVPLSNDITVIEGEEMRQVSMANQIRSIEYFIKNYQINSKYTEIRLQFPELNYFIPSRSRVSVLEEEIVFSRIKETLYSFDVKFCDTVVSVSFDMKMKEYENVKATAETISEITLKFSETDSLEYLINLYLATRHFFAFICNRKNIGLRSAILIGNYPTKATRGDKVVDIDGFTQQKLVLSEKYLEPLEEEKKIAKAPNSRLFHGKIKELFQMFCEEKAGDIAIVDVSSIHSSFKYRNLIDLEQSLHITAAFEYYVRTVLPEMSSQATVEFLNDIRTYLDEYIEKAKGGKRKKAKDFKKSLRPQISLEDKIVKSYNGYLTWKPLKPILSEWFGDNVRDLANSANMWRNELAHGKREYQPDVKVIDAVRLVEHINYCIVLRYAGYDDTQIKAILSEVLIR